MEKLINNLTYKPGWKFRLTPGRDEAFVCVSVETKVIDVDDPEKKRELTLTISTVMRPNAKEDEALEMIYVLIMELERHEIDEWFRYKGKVVHQPHPLRQDY